MAALPAHICIFEDQAYRQFLPLLYFRPVYNLRTGILSLKEKIVRRFPGALVSIQCRRYLADYMRHRNPDLLVNDVPGRSCLFINGRLLIDDALVGELSAARKDDVVFMAGDAVAAARLSGKNLERVRSRLGEPLTAEDVRGIGRRPVDARLLQYPWDLVHANGDQIRRDTRLLRKGRKSPASMTSFRRKGVTLIEDREIFVGRGTVIGPGTVIDASAGPVVLGEHVRVFPQATLIGPVFIGNGSVVKVGAQIYPDTSIGPVCKIGGEIEGSIIHGYSNKQHHGFIGHSYIGAWANLGAGTTNSDLKNNYGMVRVQMGAELIDTGHQFVGLTLGDHSKTAINSMFNTGTIVGVCSNIFGFGFPPKDVPSFSWGAAGETFTTFAIDRAIEMARRVMARRNVTLTSVEDRLIRDIFDQTADQRRRTGMPV